MKSRIILVFSFLIFTGPVFGQGTGGFLSENRLNITAGLTFGDAKFTSDDSSNDVAEYQPRLGFLLGLSKDYNLNSDIDLEATVAFINMGLKASEADYNFSLSYLSLEGLLRYTLVNGAFINGGVFLDYGLFGTQTMPSGNTAKIFKEEAFSRSNNGVKIGLGYPLSLSGRAIELSLSHRLGLSDVEGKYDQDNQKATLQMTTLGVKLLFN